ncbi:MAG: VWA domain-containing protein [Polyangiaceae bacterium]|nr:VWA domain-containing protein [Polyangiaceae bacterium]
MLTRFAPAALFTGLIALSACDATKTGTTGGAGTAGSDTTTTGAGATGGGGSGAGAGATTGSGAGGTGTAGGSTGTGGTECVMGSADCNGDPADGCEAILQSDVNNCGSCGNVCQPGGGVPPTCFVGQCKLDCPVHSGDCDGNPANGCETNTQTSDQNCGGCGSNCMGQPCVQGACACAAETAQANPVQLDLFFMLDQSGSMSETVQGGGTRWDAVTSALKSFFGDPANAGLGAGIQYFPITSGANCNPTCTTNADCGAYGPCFVFICLGCTAGGTDSCNPADYATPKVEIAPLTAAHATALSNSINAQGPTGNTPTGPALQGAVDHAKSWAMAHPSHNVVVVLATDGDPTECNPSDIPGISNIAAAAANASPKVKTFVIGVGASLSNLNAIAAAGGTGSAFIVDGNANVNQEFKAALDAIQQTALGCEYTIPQPAQGMLDYNKVNVQYTPGGGSAQVILNVANAAACDPATGGWYYDNPAAPTKIILCDATCSVVEADSAGKIEILLGCATEHM